VFLVSHRLWWRSLICRSLYKAESCSCLGKLWWIKLSPFYWSMMICFQKWIFARWCAEWESDLLDTEAQINLYPLKDPNFLSSSFFPIPVLHHLDCENSEEAPQQNWLANRLNQMGELRIQSYVQSSKLTKLHVDCQIISVLTGTKSHIYYIIYSPEMG